MQNKRFSSLVIQIFENVFGEQAGHRQNDRTAVVLGVSFGPSIAFRDPLGYYCDRGPRGAGGLVKQRKGCGTVTGVYLQEVPDPGIANATRHFCPATPATPFPSASQPKTTRCQDLSWFPSVVPLFHRVSLAFLVLPDPCPSRTRPRMSRLKRFLTYSRCHPTSQAINYF